MMEKTYPGKFMEADRLTVSVGTLMYELRIQYKGEFTNAIPKIIELENELKEFSRVISKTDDLHFHICFVTDTLEQENLMKHLSG
jgi:hypothetical protein